MEITQFYRPLMLDFITMRDLINLLLFYSMLVMESFKHIPTVCFRTWTHVKIMDTCK